jgi:hypothetical protein
MAQAAPASYASSRAPAVLNREAPGSAVTWSAVIAGAVVSAALSLILLALGTGFGLSSIAPWSSSGASATAVGAGAIIWMIVVQLIASAMGGYLAGRLRAQWVQVHSHEVYFRDTAHGFLVWSVGLVLSAAFLTSAAAAMVGASASVASSNVQGARYLNPNEYYVDSLFRSTRPRSETDAATRSEASVILGNGIRNGVLPADDRKYIADLVAARTGLNENEADHRVAQVFNQQKEAADAARKAIAHSLYWLFLALLVGAFSASFAATIGGRQRDHLPAV